jgi:hypothetical protein
MLPAASKVSQNGPLKSASVPCCPSPPYAPTVIHPWWGILSHVWKPLPSTFTPGPEPATTFVRPSGPASVTLYTRPFSASTAYRVPSGANAMPE